MSCNGILSVFLNRETFAIPMRLCVKMFTCIYKHTFDYLSRLNFFSTVPKEYDDINAYK